MFYDNLKRICKEKKVGITKIVEESGVSTGNISNWKKGVYPNSELVIYIAQQLNCTTDELLLEKEKSLERLNDNEVQLIAIYKCLDPEEQEKLRATAVDLLKSKIRV